MWHPFNSSDTLSKHIPRKRKLMLMALILTGVVNSTTLGYDTMMMAGLIAIDPFSGYFHLKPATTGLLNASNWMGGILACTFVAHLCDYVGRRVTIFFGCMLAFVGIIIQSASQNITMFCIAKIIMGIAIHMSGVAAPLLIAELAPPDMRGIIGGLYFTMFDAGAIIASAVSYGTGQINSTWAWRIPSIIQAIPSAITIAAIPFVPESPRWMVAQGHRQYARDALMICQGLDKENAEELVEKIHLSLKSTTPFAHQWRELMRPSRPMLKRILIILSFTWIVEMGGSSIGSYYLTILLQQAGISGSTKLLQINMISSCWNFFVAVVGAFTFDRLGRKPQSIISLTGMTACLFCLGGFIQKWGATSTNKSAQYATIFWMFLFNGFYSFCYTPMQTLYPTEIFPTRVRAAGTTFFQFWNCGFGLLASFVLPISMDAVGWKFYMINASYNIPFIFIIYFLWMETKNMTLEDVASRFGDGMNNAELIDSNEVQEEVSADQKLSSKNAILNAKVIASAKE